MSWRAESTFVASSKLSEEEKTFLKMAKKIREIRKLEELQKGGEKMDAKQLEKLDALPAAVKEMVAQVAKLPEKTEVFEKNPDMSEFIPNSALKEAEKKRQQEERRNKQKEMEHQRQKEIVHFQERHERPVMDIAVSADGSMIYTCSKDKMVLGWSTTNKLLEVTRTFGGHEGAVFAVDVSYSNPPRLASGAADGNVFLWPADARGSGGVVAHDSAVEHGGIVKALRWCPFEPARFATASDKLGAQAPMIAVWEARAPGKGAQCIVKMQNLPTKANAIAWGAGGKPKVFSSHDNGYVGVWDAVGGDLLKTMKLHAQPIIGLCVSTDGKTLFTSCRDMTALAVDISTRETPILRTWKTDRPLNAVAVSSDFSIEANAGAMVLGGGRQDRDITTTKECAEGEMDPQIYSSEAEWWASGKGHIGPIHAIKFISNKGFATGSEDGCIYVHDLYGKMLHSDNMRDGSR